MTARLALVVACVLLCGAPASTQAPQAPPAADGIDGLIARMQVIVETNDRPAVIALIGTGLDAFQASLFADDILRPDVRRAVVRERDRLPLEGLPEGDAYRLAIEFFTETAGRARIVTTLLDVERPSGSGADGWRITGTQSVSSVEGLYRLRVNATTQFTARGLTVRAEDLVLTLDDGTVFLIEGEDGITGLILSGRGTMRFAPLPDIEKGQLRIFAGSETLTTSFDSAFVRLHPGDFEERVTTSRMMPVAVTPRELRRAQDVFTRESPKSFSVDLSDVSSDSWSLMPQRGDVLAEVQTRRYRTLTYSRIAAQTEDITLFDRERRKTISLYASAERLAALGRAYNEADLRDYDVLEYTIDARVFPERERLEARARMRLRVRSAGLSSITLRLADSLEVTGIGSVEHGRLLHLRISGQNTIIVSLPATVLRDEEITLVMAYAGRMTSQNVDTENVAVAAAQDVSEFPSSMLQSSFLLSNRAFWYPQNPIGDYAMATLRVTVPAGYSCVASGVRQAVSEVLLRDLATLPPGSQTFTFTATQPLRYLAVVVSRLTRVAESVVTTSSGDRVALTVEANPRQQGRGRELMGTMDNMIRFYSDLVGDAPYDSATLALLEGELPGGHSPGYLVVLNTPLPGILYTWGNDPATFEDFPDFFLAHEVAHQWWGQGVGWRNYHEQWISEGFAQYFAALYARSTRGEQTFNGMLRQFRRWSLAESDEGPVILGFRLGHVKEDQRIFRALVYNKAAGVLHMLRRLIGDQAFFAGLRRFYTEQKFQRTGTEDARRAFESESGRSLERFFERWIYGSAVPRLRVTRSIGAGVVTVSFDQIGEPIFDLPVTVTVLYSDGRSEDIAVPVTERQVAWRLETRGGVRQVQINRDNAAIAEFQIVN